MFTTRSVKQTRERWKTMEIVIHHNEVFIGDLCVKKSLVFVVD